MKFSALLLAALLFVASSVEVVASESTTSIMTELMQEKIKTRQKWRDLGVFKSKLYSRLSSFQPCKNGKSGRGKGKESFKCNKIDMTAFISHEDMGSETREGNDVWGWTSPDGREFVAVGQTDGTAFLEVRFDGYLDYLGRLPTQTEPSIWRDIKVIDGYAYIGSEAEGHGLQIFDMRKLLNIKPWWKFWAQPVVFDIKKDQTAWFSGFGSSHNIVANEDTKFIYAVGSDVCQGGLFIVDVSDPANPTSPGCASQDGYVHDAQCVIYTGPDTKYTGHEICFAYNEDTLTIMDMTDKSTNGSVISRSPYQAAYTHQGWLIDTTNQNFLLLDDELDEMRSVGEAADQHTTTYIWNITSLEAPIKTGNYKSPAIAIDHNQYVVKGLSYQANYGSGLRVVDVRSVESDPTGTYFKEVGFFDIFPEDDEQNGGLGLAEFTGTWSVYPYFKSGYIILNTIERGTFSLKLQK
ncbi:hypothetical protein BDZ91DRAFT_757660 [Kalaharituber pfeilii]|nr:hypothetical protein BDZ91DRAFT_757660 [Kalaharituber pfeilii]